ncbi:MAG: CHAT domain-containing protein [Oscillatoria sp. PMC 1068.18]|nr:CHAT domain-containing protein [Oscillatoria sp. PMC 1076.18]MEC4989192.1 CHAT domain-containing protein [Oscillatoria sp. PMC 1068.18]
MSQINQGKGFWFSLGRFSSAIGATAPVAIFFALGFGEFGGLKKSVQAAESYRSFVEWCQNRSRLSESATQTVDLLLQQVGTTDCEAAQKLLAASPGLSLTQVPITDLSPLASLTHLTNLSIVGTQVSDVSPLANLTNLTYLVLGFNQIRDVTPLANLTNLTYLDFTGNQITDISSLAPLTKLNSIGLLNNPIQAKVCPLEPANKCIFDNSGQDIFVQGEQQFQQGNFLAALNSYNQVLEVYQRESDSVKEGDTLNRIGDTYVNLSNYPQALESYKQALALRQELGDLPGVSVTLTGLAAAYERLGRYPKALTALESALAIVREQDENFQLRLDEAAGGFWELPKEQATLLNNLALVQNRLGQHEKALKSAEEALATFRLIPEAYGTNTKRYGEAISLDTLGVTYAELGQREKALEVLQQALTIAKEIGDRTTEAQILNHLGEILSETNQQSEAISVYQQALAIRQEIGDRAGIGATLNNLGITYLKSQQYSQAETQLFAAIKVWESLRPGLTDENKVSLAEKQNQTYNYLQETLIAQNKIEAALEIAERGRARAFIELLAANFAENPPDINPPNIQKIKQIAQQQNATLVEYSLIGDKIYTWVIQPTGAITFRNLEISSQLQNQTLAQLVKNTRDGLFIPPFYPSEELQKLHQILIAPIADLLPENANQRIIFIPQKELFLVPFVALLDEKEQYLVQKHTLLTAPAIQVLDLTRQQREKNQQTNPQHSLIVGFPRDQKVINDLILGNPEMPKNPETGETLMPLKGAEAEAQQIAEFLNTDPLLGIEATKNKVLQLIESSRIVHIATHGLLEDVVGLGVPGALALAPSSEDRGFLTSSEILDLNLNAELVVLSACDTAQGDIKSDGVIGLSRSFIAAGTPSIIVTLWKIPDDATAFLMNEFYQQLDSTGDKAVALRQAMLATMEQFPDPENWAAPTLIGEAE